MKERPYYKHYTEDFLHGTRELTPLAELVFRRMVDWMYDRGGPIKDDEKGLAHDCRISLKMYKILRQELLDKRKLFYVDEDLPEGEPRRLINKRAAAEMKDVSDLSTRLSTVGKAGRKKQLDLGLNPTKTPRKSNENQTKIDPKSSQNSENINDFNDRASANARESRVQSPESIKDHTIESVTRDGDGRSFAHAKGGKSEWWFEPDDDTLDQVRKIAPGWDRQHLLAQYRAFAKTREKPNAPQKAFIGWLKAYTKGQKP